MLSELTIRPSVVWPKLAEAVEQHGDLFDKCFTTFFCLSEGGPA